MDEGLMPAGVNTGQESPLFSNAWINRHTKRPKGFSDPRGNEVVRWRMRRDSGLNARPGVG